MDAQTQTVAVIEEVRLSPEASLPIGAELNVPSTHTAVFVHEGNIAYTLPGGGTLKILASDFPLLKVKSVKGGGPQGALDAAAYLIRADEIELPWESQAIWTNGPRRGLTYQAIRGTARVRIEDAPRFFGSTQEVVRADAAANSQPKTFRLSQPKKQIEQSVREQLVPAGNAIIPTIVAGVTDGIVEGRALQPETLSAAREDIVATVREQGAPVLAERGVRLLDLRITEISGPFPLACSRCGTTLSPTSPAAFRYNVSLFYVRFGGEQRGAFCRACALKVGLGYSALTATCGWWGIIGLFLTPVYVPMNLYNAVKVLATRPVPSAALSGTSGSGGARD